MRVRTAAAQDRDALASFASYLLDMGNGRLPRVAGGGDHEIALDARFGRRCSDTDELIRATFPSLSPGAPAPNLNPAEVEALTERLTNRAILATRNDRVREINSAVTACFPGETVVYESVDRTEAGLDHLYPVEYLNTLEMSGIPPHRLELKVGMPIMLIRNLNPDRGLCNGTRLIVRILRPHTIVARICTGIHKGLDVTIPRFQLHANEDETLPVPLIRRQFPAVPCWAMSVNKAQGQTLAFAGLHLEDPAFTHGQLYVAWSRVGSPSNVAYFVPGRRDRPSVTKNVVYTQVL